MKDYSTGEAAQFLGLPRRTVSRYCAVGRIPATQHPVSKVWKIKHEDLLQFIHDNGLDSSNLMPPTKVLIVDDEEAVTSVITRILSASRWNLSVDSTDNGYEALVMIGIEIPDLVILDFKMPKMDGKEVLRALKRGENTKNIKVLVVTGYSDKIDEMMNLGADAALAKPFDSDKLIETMSSLLPGVDPFVIQGKVAKGKS